MFYTKIICGYLTPFDTINMCCTCKHLYTKIDEHMLNTRSTNEFRILKKDEYETGNEKYILGIGQVTLFMRNFNIINTKMFFKNVEFFLSSGIIIKNSIVSFEDCLFYSENRFGLLDIKDSSNVLLLFCYIKDFKMFCKTYDSVTDFKNTIFENVLVPIIGRIARSDILDSRFINCNMPINYFENFRLVIRNTFLHNCVYSLIIHTCKNRNHLEIGDCQFLNCIKPKIYLSNENTIDIYSNIY